MMIKYHQVLTLLSFSLTTSLKLGYSIGSSRHCVRQYCSSNQVSAGIIIIVTVITITIITYYNHLIDSHYYYNHCIIAGSQVAYYHTLLDQIINNEGTHIITFTILYHHNHY